MKSFLNQVQEFINGEEAKDFFHELVVAHCKIKQAQSRGSKSPLKNFSSYFYDFCFEEAVFDMENGHNMMALSWGYEACPSMYGESIEIFDGNIYHTTWNPIPIPIGEGSYFARYRDVFDEEGRWKKFVSIPDPMEIDHVNKKLKPILLIDSEKKDVVMHKFYLELEDGSAFGLNQFHESPKKIELESIKDFFRRKFNSYINVILLGFDDEIFA